MSTDVLSDSFQPTISCDDGVLTVERRSRATLRLRLDELDEIGVETTDKGPFADDVFLVFKKSGEVFRVSDSAVVSSDLVGEFGKLDGFDFEQFIAAQSSTSNQYFLCWAATSEK